MGMIGHWDEHGGWVLGLGWTRHWDGLGWILGVKWTWMDSALGRHGDGWTWMGMVDGYSELELVGLGLGIDLVLDGHGGCLESMGWTGWTYTTGQRSCSEGAWGAPAAGLGWACRQVQKTWRILIF
jgi:hypothetical protein